MRSWRESVYPNVCTYAMAKLSINDKAAHWLDVAFLPFRHLVVALQLQFEASPRKTLLTPPHISVRTGVYQCTFNNIGVCACACAMCKHG